LKSINVITTKTPVLLPEDRQVHGVLLPPWAWEGKFPAGLA